MKVVILEDEKSAAENLKYLLNEVDPSIYVDKTLDTVSDAVSYFSDNHDIELAFFDIHLADGISFEIFNELEVKVPVIFTTAYDEYALRAFKVNSIDYLLKPIDEDELKQAIHKFKSSKESHTITDQFQDIIKKLISEAQKKYKSSFLVQQRDILIPIGIDDIAYFTIESGLVKAINFNNSSYIIDEKLDDLESNLHPDQFFRANRQFIVQKKAIVHLTIYFNGKLILTVEPKSKERIIISKAKAPLLKKWIK